jgi:hypothetical protein
MKSIKHILILVLFLPVALLAQTYTSPNDALRVMFGNLDWNPVGTYTTPSGLDVTPQFLYSMSSHIAPDQFYAPMCYDTSNLDNFFYAYEAMFYAAKDTMLWERPDSLAYRGFQFNSDTIPFFLFNFDYLDILDTALKCGDYFTFDTVNGKLYDHPNPIADPFSLGEIFMAANSKETHQFTNVTYTIDPSLFAFCSRNIYKKNNFPESKLRIRFGDGSGWHEFNLSSTSYITIDYPQAGNYLTEVEFIESGGTINHSAFKTSILSSDQSIPPDFTIDIKGLNVGVYGGCGTGTQALEDKKFIIYLEGIDLMDFLPGVNRDIKTIYNDMMKDEDLVELRNFGYSFVVVDWKNSRKDMTYNAMHIVALIDHLKCTYPNDHEIVVIGESMGGVIGRYALTFMETDDYQDGYWSYTDPTTGIAIDFKEPCKPELMHKTRLLMTFDSPHQGANVPLSLQEFYKSIFEGALGLAGIGKVLTAPVRIVMENVFNVGLGSDAVEQLLLYHADMKNPFCNTSVYNCYYPHWKHTNFFDRLEEMGDYPRYCKLMALSNGALAGNKQTRAYSHADRIAGDILFKFDSEIYARVLHFIKIPVFGANIDLRTNPQGNGKLCEFGWGTWGIKIKPYWFGLKVNVGLISFGSDEIYGANLNSYCTNAGGVYRLSGLQPSSNNFNDSPKPWPGRDFPLFKYSASNNGDGSYNLNAEVGIPWVAQAGVEIGLMSDGFHFGFIPVKSGLDWGNVKATPLSPDIQNTGWPARVYNSPFDVIAGISDQNPYAFPNVDGASAYDWNRHHLNVENAAVRSRPNDPFLRTCGFETYILNREIGDEILYLNNRELPWTARFESEFDIEVNSGNNNPHYEYQSGNANQNMLYWRIQYWGGFYSKEIAFTISAENPIDFHNPNVTFKFGDAFSYNDPFPPAEVFVEPLQEHLEICCFRSEEYKTSYANHASETESKELQSSLTAYPNPFSESVSVVINHNKNEKGQLVVYNSIGAIVLNTEVTLKASATVFKNLNIGAKPGVYIVNLVDSQGKIVSSQKIIAQ